MERVCVERESEYVWTDDLSLDAREFAMDVCVEKGCGESVCGERE